jgi:hypothetical protein
MTVYLNIGFFASFVDHDEFSVNEIITRIGIDIDHEAEWRMPEGLSEAHQKQVSELMREYIDHKWERPQRDHDEYLTLNRESA